MTAHELANFLLTLPDIPVVVICDSIEEVVNAEVMNNTEHWLEDKPGIKEHRIYLITE